MGLRGLVEHQGLMVELEPTSGGPITRNCTTAAVLVFAGNEAAGDERLGLQAEIARWERQAAIDAVAVEEIRSNLDLAVRADVFSLLRKVDPDSVAPANQANSPRRRKLEAVRRAYDAVNGHEQSVARCEPAVVDLLSRWKSHQALVDESQEHLDQVTREVDQAEYAVEAAQAAVEQAKDAARPLLLTPAQETRLETLTDAWNEANEDKKRKGLSPEEEQERLDLLARVNMRSWTEYTVFRLSPTVAPELLAGVEEARRELRVATQTLDRARDFRDRDEVTDRIRENLQGIKKDAQPFLGVLIPADIGAALEAQIEWVDNPDWVSAMDDLRDVLSANNLHPPVQSEEILGWTDSWLRAQDSLDSNGAADGQSSEDDDLALLRRLAGARHSLAKHNRALSQMDLAERNAVRSGMRVRDLKAQLRERSTAPDPTTASEVVAMVRPVADQVIEDIEGSLPIAVVGDLAGLPDLEAEVLMSQLEEIAKRVQIILVSGHSALPGWAKRAGLERALLVDGIRALV